jgi:hypothetical protein
LLIKPDIKLFCCAFITILVKQSVTILKARGERGSPCLRPLQL